VLFLPIWVSIRGLKLVRVWGVGIAWTSEVWIEGLVQDDGVHDAVIFDIAALPSTKNEVFLLMGPPKLPSNISE
jgi:hypothetical protein